MMKRAHIIQQRRLMIACLLTLLSWTTSSSFAVTKKCPKGTKVYEVQVGDSPWSLAQRFLQNSRRYKQIYRANKIRRGPFRLKPGQVICMPGNVPDPDALVVRPFRDVRSRAPRAVDWRNVSKKRSTRLWRRYRIKTGKKSYTGLRFFDRSYLRVRERSLVVIFGSSASRVRRKRLKKTKVLVEQGVVRGGLASLGSPDALRTPSPGTKPAPRPGTKPAPRPGIQVVTPSAKIQLDGTKDVAQIEVDPKKTSAISVYRGKIAVKAAGKTVQVPKDFGTVVKKGRAPAKPRPLPKAPVWLSAKRELVLFQPIGGKTLLRLSWKPHPNAKMYNLEISSTDKSKTFVRQLKIYRPGLTNARFVSLKLRVGTYYARVSVKDKDNLESRWSKLMRIRVLRLRSSRKLQEVPTLGSKTPKTPVFEAAGMLRLSAPTGFGGRVEMMKGNARRLCESRTGFRSFQKPLWLSQPGLYVFCFRAQGEQGKGTPLKVRLLATQARFSSSTQRFRVGGNAQVLSLRLEAKRSVLVAGNLKKKSSPVSLPGLQVKAYPGGVVSCSMNAQGVCQVRVPAPKVYPGRKVVVRASWAGGDLAQTEIPVIAPPPPRRVIRKRPPPPPRFRWSRASAAVEAGQGGPGLPSRAARPISAVGLSSAVLGFNEAVYLRMALRGQLALLDGRLGLDIDLPWLHSDLLQNRDSASARKIGDVRLGAKFLLLERAGFLLTPSLRISLPTGGFRDHGNSSPLDVRGAAFEPGLLLQWDAVDWLSLMSNQIFVIRTDLEQLGLFYASTYGAEARFGMWSVLLELQFNAGLSADAAPGIGLMLHGAIRWQWDRLRVALFGGAGLTEASRIGIGGFAVGLSLDVGLGG